MRQLQGEGAYLEERNDDNRIIYDYVFYKISSNASLFNYTLLLQKFSSRLMSLSKRHWMVAQNDSKALPVLPEIKLELANLNHTLTVSGIH